MTLPNFLIIGAAKAGTTALDHYLKQHPEVFMSEPKEPRFFIYEGQSSNYIRTKTFKDYQALFDGVTTEKAIGEASTDYLFSPAAAGRIKATLPDVRLIVSLRNPVERAYSVYQMNQRNKLRDPGLSFREAFRKPAALTKTYAEHLEIYLALFGRDRLKILLFEEIEQDTAGTMAGIFAFLGIDGRFCGDFSKVPNPGGIPRSWMLNALLTDRRIQRTGYALLSQALIDRARKLRRQNLAKKPMSEDDRAQALAHFREDILRTQDLIGRDLSAWLGA